MGKKRLIVSDLSAIEARVLAWLSGEQWRLEVFATHGKIYEASASQMFGVPLERIKKGNPEYALRQKGKISELALGYGGGPNALITMGALNMGLKEEELPETVKLWRAANRNVVSFWYDMDRAAKQAIHTGHSQVGRIEFSMHRNVILYMHLPSGRRLAYLRPRIEMHEGRENVTYEGTNQYTRKWERLRTYGGKWVENATQAVARDVLRDALLNIDAGGKYDIIGHVHDEIITESEDGTPEELEMLMSQALPWAKGLPLAADGFESTYYRK